MIIYVKILNHLIAYIFNMWMLKCLLYTICKYFKDQTKNVHFIAKHTFLDFVNKLSMNKIVTCATSLIQTKVLFCKLKILLYHTHDLVYLPSAEFKLYEF